MRNLRMILLVITFGMAGWLMVSQAPGAAQQPTARSLIPSKAELASVGFSGYLLPWEIKNVYLGSVMFVPRSSEADFINNNDIVKALRNKQQYAQQLNQISDGMLSQMRDGMSQQLKMLDKGGLKPATLLPTPMESIQEGMIELVRTGKFDRNNLRDLYSKHLNPLNDAMEIPYARYEIPKIKPDDDAVPLVRAAKLVIRIYMYDANYVRANPSDFTITKDRLAYLENRYREFFTDALQLVRKSAGEDQEHELAELLVIPSRDRTDSINEKIAEIMDGLDVIDMLDENTHRISSEILRIGDTCASLYAVYTFPENLIKSLHKIGGNMSTQVESVMRVGSAMAHISMLTNKNDFWNREAWNKLLTHLASKLQGFKIQ
ncbi:hypothetical protein ACFLT9_01965 [Acidobacteriota bacterium]